MQVLDILKNFELSDDVDLKTLLSDAEIRSITAEYNEFDILKLRRIVDEFDRKDSNREFSLDRLKVLVKEDNMDYIKMGEAALSKGRVALFIVAGGMGSRLGFDYPKGMYEVLEGVSIYDVFFRRLKALGDRVGRRAHVFIMTSRQNNEQTVSFFEHSNYFDYGKDYVHFFQQGELPPLSENKKLFLDDNKHILTAPDGNGGIYKAIRDSYVKDFLLDNDIDYINIVGVDNVLLKPLDPEFIGATISKGYHLASKSVIRTYADEKVGYLLRKNGSPSIVEYTEVSEDMRRKTMVDGEFYFADANILSHIIEVKALFSLLETELKYHKAFKKISYYDGAQHIKPDRENAYKFEQFVFDVFEKFDDMLIFRVSREKEFSPLKNKT